MGKDTLYRLRHSMELWVIPATDRLEAVELIRSGYSLKKKYCKAEKLLTEHGMVECQLLGPDRDISS